MKSTGAGGEDAEERAGAGQAAQAAPGVAGTRSG
jgi:hypothetical protein